MARTSRRGRGTGTEWHEKRADNAWPRDGSGEVGGEALVILIMDAGDPVPSLTGTAWIADRKKTARICQDRRPHGGRMAL